MKHMYHLDKTGGVFLVDGAGRVSAELECKCSSCTGMAIHAGVFGSTEAGRDAAEMRASECIVGILIRLEVYVEAIVIAHYLVCHFVGDKFQSMKIRPYTPLWGSFDREGRECTLIPHDLLTL